MRVGCYQQHFQESTLLLEFNQLEDVCHQQIEPDNKQYSYMSTDLQILNITMFKVTKCTKKDEDINIFHINARHKTTTSLLVQP